MQHRDSARPPARLAHPRWLFAALLCGCPAPVQISDAGSPPVDAGADAGGPPYSVCGFPGDPGNSLGVGQYCQQISECPFSAPICSDLQNDPNDPTLHTFFCVLPCDECMPPGFCGENASCVCPAPHRCGCVPDACSAIFPPNTYACDNDAGTPGDAGTSDAGPADSGTVADDGGCASSPPGTCAPQPCGTGNALHVGAYCTKGGSQCAQYILFCSIDISPNGANFCISLGCTKNSDCGAGACCTSDNHADLHACVPQGCLVTDGGGCPPPP